MTDAPKYSVCTYTPEKAEDILANRNPKNRLISRIHVNKMADDMRNGRWDSNNGETVCFDTDGNLIDGQHRLAAIVQSGETVSLMTIKNLPAKARDTIDQGRRRSMSDRLKMDGTVDKYRGRHVSATRFLLGLQDGVLFAPSISDSRLQEWIEDNVEKIADINENYIADIGRYPFTQHGFLAAAYTLYDIDSEMMGGFFRELTNNSGSAGSATRALYTYMASSTTRKLNAAETYFLTIRAWNDWLDNKTVRTYRIPRELTVDKIPVPKRV